jgi:3-deoxy-D-manno-octulosonic-acid transferase
MKDFWFVCYQFLALLCLPFVLVSAAIHILFKPEHLRPYLQKFSFVLPKAAPKTSQRRVWIHGVSVGEVISCGPIIEIFEKSGFSVYLSTSTSNGFTSAQKRYSNVGLFYFPFDYSFMCKRVLKRIEPDVMLLCEVEIWPAFIRTARNQDVPLFLVSGRLTKIDFRNYRMFKFFFRHVLSLFNGLFMQTDLDAKRMNALCDHKNVKSLGSLKFDVVSNHSDYGATNFLPDGFLICAASTHRGEEESILSAFKRLSTKYPEIKFAIAPRHLDRVEEIVRILGRLDLEFTLRSNNTKCNTPVFVLDSMGELAGVFPKCELVIMGGSFIKNVRGHNIMEPSWHKKCVLCGSQTVESHGLFSMYQSENALVLTSLQNLFHDLDALVADRARSRQVGINAFHLSQQNRGAAQRIYAEVMQGLKQRGHER